MTTLCVGTEQGLHLLVEAGSAGQWRERARFLDGVAISSVAVTPNRPGEITISTLGQGLFRLAWQRRTLESLGADTLPAKLWSVALADPDGERLYVGSEPPGIYASDDAGASWQRLEQVNQLEREFDWKYHPVPNATAHIRQVVVSPTHPERLYAAVQVGGVLRSEDAGRTWSDVVDGIDPDVHALALHPNDPDRVYAACGGGGRPDAVVFPPEPPLGLPLYASNDQGKTWQCLSLGFERTYAVQVLVHPAHPDTLLAGLARGEPPHWRDRPTYADAVLAFSHDGGRTWQEGGEGLPSPSPRMIEALAVDPLDVEHVFVGLGGPAARMLPASEQRGDIYHTHSLDHGWQRMPIDLPPVYNLTFLA